MKICLIVDSNLKYVSKEMFPLLSCEGDLFVPYLVKKDSESWPSVGQLKEAGYTDVLVGLGTNHCKHPGDEWRKGAEALSEIISEWAISLPGVRLYCLLPPPSVSSAVSARVQLYSTWLRGHLERGVIVIAPPSFLYTEEGTLKEGFARERELESGVKEHQKVHLNEAGVKVLTERVQTVLLGHIHS